MSDRKTFKKIVADKEALKRAAERRKGRNIWLGLGVIGVVGWSIAIPMLAGVALGLWLDKKFPESFSWTLTCLFVGVAFGCLNAWHWISKERKSIEKDNKK